MLYSLKCFAINYQLLYLESGFWSNHQFQPSRTWKIFKCSTFAYLLLPYLDIEVLGTTIGALIFNWFQQTTAAATDNIPPPDCPWKSLDIPFFTTKIIMIVCFAFCLVYCNLVGITFMFSWSVRCCRAGLASVNRTSTLLWCTYRCFLFCGASSLRTNLTVCLFYLRTQLFRRTVIFLVLKCSCSFLGSKM